jgi:hypothetical protein
VQNQKREREKKQSREETKSCVEIRKKDRGKWQVMFANAVLLRMGRRRHDF